MNLIYGSIVLMGFFPIFITVKRIMRYKTIAKNGITIKAQIVNKQLVPFFRGRQVVKLHLRYKHINFDDPIISEATTADNNYNIGDFLDISYQKTKSKIFIKGDEKGYYPILGFAVVLFLFACFAVYMIRDMEINGY